MKYNVYRFLSLLNRLCLPQLYKKRDLTTLTPFDKAIVGWKILVTYRLLDAQSAQVVAEADSPAKKTHGA